MNLFSQIFPKPQKVKSSVNRFPIPSTFPFFCENPSFNNLEKYFLEHGFSQSESSDNALILVVQKKSQHPEGYSLQISPSKIILSAETEVGMFRALQTFLQIIDLSEDYIPCCEIEDFPFLERRGFMLDVSRCKVPTMESLFSLIDLLVRLHINELQLYIEHTFSFKEHLTVWKNSSPFTSEEIQAIDQYCSERFIELVPNLNSFGHFERWLMHADYKHLAECPDGFKRENPYIVRDHGTTLKPNKESLNFINSLYDEYLPNFSSDKFNVGMDEPWELGQGWSKNEIEQKGKAQVYLDHLDGIRKLVESHGKKMQFWADVLLEKPENAKLLPSSASPIIWGYEPTHPFSEQAQAIAKCGLQYCLAPGTGNWRSFSGRWPNAQVNIDLAITNAKEHNAEGVLLTSWGDCGNHQPWATLYPPLLYGAAKSWNNEPVSRAEIISGLDFHLFQNQSNTPSSSLLELGNLDKTVGSDIPNTSLCWYLLFAPLREKLISFLKEKHKVSQLQDGIDHLQSVKNTLSSNYTEKHSSLVAKEINLGIELSNASLEMGINLLKGNDVLPSLKKELVNNYQALWLSRARSGGLDESTEILVQAGKAQS